MRTISDMHIRIRNKANEDEGFWNRLIADPKSVISAVFGVFIPEEFNVQVHKESITAAHFVLPPSSRLTEEDMAKVAGE